MISYNKYELVLWHDEWDEIKRLILFNLFLYLHKFAHFIISTVDHVLFTYLYELTNQYWRDHKICDNKYHFIFSTLKTNLSLVFEKMSRRRKWGKFQQNIQPLTDVW